MKFGPGVTMRTMAVKQNKARCELVDMASDTFVFGPAASRSDPGATLCERRFLREAARRAANARRNPIGEWDFLRHVMARTRVDFTHLRQVLQRKAASHTDESRPDAPMDKRDFAVDEATDEHVAAVADRSCHCEDLVAFRMRPPAAANRLSGDELG